METLQHIFASFDISSIISAIFPALTKSFEHFFSILYSNLISGLAQTVEKFPVIIPVAIFLSFYFLISSAFAMKKQLAKVRK